MDVKTSNVVHGLTIEKGIKIPGKRTGGTGKWSDVCDLMGVGDSVLVATHNHRLALATRINSRRGYRAVSRKADGKFRVWKKADGRR